MIKEGFKLTIEDSLQEFEPKMFDEIVTIGITKEELMEFINSRIETKAPDDNIEFPLPTHKEVLEDKKFPYNTFAALMVNSKFDSKANNFYKNYRNYLYTNRMGDVMEFLNKLEEAKGTKLTNKRTIERHIKTILDCGLDLMDIVNTPQGVAYKIKSSVDNKYYVKIPYTQIKELLVSTNKNMLKLFAFMKYMCNEETFKPITREFIAEHIGLSPNSRNNIQTISTMTTSLAKLGFIEIRQINKLELNKKGQRVFKTINSYRLRSLEEYNQITEIAKGQKVN